jgi:hypothetical protein
MKNYYCSTVLLKMNVSKKQFYDKYFTLFTNFINDLSNIIRKQLKEQIKNNLDFAVVLDLVEDNNKMLLSTDGKYTTKYGDVYQKSIIGLLNNKKYLPLKQICSENEEENAMS